MTGHPLSLTNRCVVFVCAVLLTVYCFLPTAVAQSTTATLTGTVEDQNGAVIPGVSITIQNTATSFERQTVTSDAGGFIVPLLPPGNYTVTVKRDGFTPVEIRNVILNVGDQKSLPIVLKAGGVTETVLIDADAPLINESPAVGTVVDRQFVGNLPLNGRSFQSLITLTPGTVLTKTNLNDQGQFSVNGQRSNANYFTIDGVGANIGVVAAVPQGQSAPGSLPGLSSSGGTNNLVSIDALQEFKVLTSTYAPEFGRTPGAQVSIITRPGTNKFSGTVFEYFRNEALDATDWFNNAKSLAKPALRQNNFGGVLGGPILHDKTFFFFSYEGLRLRLPNTTTTPVPTLAARQAAVPAIRPFFDAFPIPNGRDFGNGTAEFIGSFSNPSSLDATSIRIDHYLGGKLALFGRYNYAPSETSERGVAIGGNSLNSITATRLKTQTLTAGVTYSIAPAISNELRFNWSRNKGSGNFLLDDFGGAVVPSDSVLFAPGSPAGNSTLVFLIANPQMALTVGKIADNEQRQLNIVDNLSMVTGSHTLKFGVDYRRLSPVLSPTGYNSTAVFLFSGAQAGVALQTAISAGAGKIYPVFNNFSAYGQDTWKVTPRLALTYGLRWEVNPPPTESKGKHPAVVAGLENPATMVLAPFGTPLYKTTYNNFAPRFGLSYLLRTQPGRETVIRGGVGVFYDLGTGQAGNAFSGFPYTRSKTLIGRPFPLSAADAAPPSFATLTPPFNVIAFEPNLELPRTYQWNLSLEQSIGAKQTVTASYVAALGRKLLRTEQLIRPNPNFGNVSITRNLATSDYHAFQLQFARRLSRGLQALVSYTWSHSIDIASSDSFLTASANFSDPNLDRGSSDFDVRHAFSSAVTYNLPTPKWGGFGRAVLGGWSVDTIVTARSATPVDIIGRITQTAAAGFFSLLRPDLVPNQPLYIDDSQAPGGRRFNPAAFVQPPVNASGRPLRQGTLGRNVLRGFPFYQVDLALRRQFNITERVKLQLRAELFNLFNHPNFADPGSTGLTGTKYILDPQFGRSVSMLGRGLGSGGVNGGFNPLYQVGGPRSVQLAFKVQF